MPGRYDFVAEDDRRLKRRREQLDLGAAMDRQVTPQAAARAIQVARSFPNAQSGTVQTAVSGQLNDAETVALASVDDGGGFSPFDVVGKVLEWGDNAFNAVWQQGIMPTLRGAFVAFEGLYKEAVEAPIVAVGSSIAEGIDRSPLSDTLFRGQDLVQGASLNPVTNYQRYGRSAAFRAGQALLDGPGGVEFDLGKGVLLDQESEIGSMVVADHRLRVRGEEAKIGNFTAATWLTPIGFSPGDTAYDTVSGIQQLAAEILLDPATLLTAGSTTLAKGAARLGASADTVQAVEGGISGSMARARATETDAFRDIARRLSEVRDDAGNVLDEAAEQSILDEAMGLVNRNGNSRQRTVLPEKALPWAQNHDVNRVVAEMDPYDLQQVWSRRGAARMKGEVLGELGRAEDPTEVAEILTREITRGYLPEKGFFTPQRVAWRNAINESKLSNISGMASTGTMPADDLYTASRKADTFMKAGNVPENGYARVRIGDDTTTLKLADEVTEADDVVETFGGRRQIINQILTLEPGNQKGMRDIVDEMLTSTKFATPEWGGKMSRTDWESAQNFVRQWRDETDRAVARLQRFNTDSMGSPLPTQFDEVAIIEGQEVRTFVPHFVSEGKQLSDVMLPDVIELRRAATQSDTIRKLYQSAGWDSVARRARWFTSNVFKPSVLFRPAYAARVLPDDQGRMHFSGYESMFDGPYSYLVGNVTNQRAATDLMGTNLMERKEAARLFGIDLNPRSRMDRTQQWVPIFKQENFVNELDEAGELIGRTYSDDYLDAWHTELAQAASDDAARFLLHQDNPGDYDALRAWLLSDEVIPEVTTQRSGQEALQGMRFMWGDEAEEVVRRGGQEWEALARSWHERLQRKFAGEAGRPIPEDLRRAALGRSEDFNFFDDLGGKGPARRFLSQYADEYGPTGLKRELPPGSRGSGFGSIQSEKSKFSDIVDTIGDWIIKRPTNYFSRNPLWRQAIAGKLEDMMPSISRELRDEVVERATDLGVSDEWMARLRKAADEAEGDGFIDDIRTVNEEAITQATFVVEDLLFDVNTRSALQENHEVFVPFVDAWRESIEIWSGIVKRNPQVVTRGMSILRGGESSGFIHTNENGERMFTIPNPTPALRTLANAASRVADPFNQFEAGNNLGDTLFGPATGDSAEVQLAARVEAMNMVFSSIGPGFGPVVQWPVAAFAPKGFEDSGLADLVIPYGAELEQPSDLADPLKLARQITPAWAKKVFNAATEGGWDETQYQSMVNEALDAMGTTGDYDLSDPLERQRLERDAKRSAQWLMMLRGLAHGTLPAGPGVEWRVRVEEDAGFEPEPWNPDEDPDGRWFTIGQMAEEYRNLVRELNDPDLAVKRFIQQYGYEPYLLSQPLTDTYGPRPTDPGGAQWMAENEELVRAHPHVAGFFAPELKSDDPFAGFDEWRKQIEEGTRDLNDAETQIALSQRAKAYQIYNNVKKLLPEGLPRKDRNMRLALVRGALNEEFPGWLNPMNSVGATKIQGTEQYVEEFRAVANDPGLSDNPIAQRVKLYLTVRDAALARLREQTGDPRASLGRQEAEQVREALVMVGNQLRDNDESGGFAAPWRILSRELEVA